jgi:choline dehydrogenase-like flavoprotein
VSVLLLEAGGDDTQLEIAIPAASAQLQLSDNSDWGWKSTPQKFSHFGMTNNVSVSYGTTLYIAAIQS